MYRKLIKDALAYEQALLNIYKDSQLDADPKLANIFREYALQSEKRIKELHGLFNQCLGG